MLTCSHGEVRVCATADAHLERFGYVYKSDVPEDAEHPHCGGHWTPLCFNNATLRFDQPNDWGLQYACPIHTEIVEHRCEGWTITDLRTGQVIA